MPTTNVPPAGQPLPLKVEPIWPNGWWKLMEARIGVIPLPVYVLLLGLIAGFVLTGGLPTEINVAIAVLAVGGFTCGEFGKRLPYLRHVGAAAICATFIPSFLAFHKLLPETLVKGVTDFTKSTNFLYLFIAAIIVGSILSMDRCVLIKGFVKIFVPLACGSIVAMIVGTGVGIALGLGAYRTFYFIVVPIMAGGVGEGAIPLSVGYAGILHQQQGDLFAQILPSVMLGSLSAILLSGLLNYVGERYPQLTGKGRLQPGEHDDMDPAQEEISGHMDVSHIAAAGVTAVSLYLVGLLAFRLFAFPAPVTMLFLAVLVKLTQAVSPKLQEGAFVVYKFFSTAVTYPLLFAIGVAMTPWDKLVSAFTWANLITIVATVMSLMATGFFVGRWMNMYPIETAIVNACHSGQGGTGDVAILTASNRMTLMPFAQIATRIGGAITVTLTLIALARSV
ncbi:2-hydroxycarboxylate transporter family protein [Dokdonella soli]|uniref:2-hydroxycarboxylate transporter family protein n=1 Tax=Dokdonella soli TaxID=529810 RepID=A0ABN1II97_9GAMM